MHEGAAQAAVKRGITIVGTDFYELGSLEGKYDWVVAFDVIEHSDDPREFLRQLASKCTPGGHVIISTGNIDAPSWRLMGSRYWYCTIAEHLAFISPAWCESAAAHCGLRLVRHCEFSHNPSSMANRASQLLKNVFYRFAPSAAAWARSAGFGKENVAQLPALRYLPPQWGCARDHFIALFCADSQPSR
jgi:2-polyprenyl-3-methyl-5-hydroxy-6-metoxy-1,4-benzoquinol methylase